MEKCDFLLESDEECGKIPTIPVIIDDRQRYLCRTHYQQERDRIYGTIEKLKK